MGTWGKVVASRVGAISEETEGDLRERFRGPHWGPSQPPPERCGLIFAEGPSFLLVSVNGVVGGGSGGPAPPGHVASVGGETPGRLERPSQKELDLRRRAAQLVGRPASESIVNGRVDAKEKVLTPPC